MPTRTLIAALAAVTLGAFAVPAIGPAQAGPAVAPPALAEAGANVASAVGYREHRGYRYGYGPRRGHWYGPVYGRPPVYGYPRRAYRGRGVVKRFDGPCITRIVRFTPRGRVVRIIDRCGRGRWY